MKCLILQEYNYVKMLLQFLLLEIYAIYTHITRVIELFSLEYSSLYLNAFPLITTSSFFNAIFCKGFLFTKC